MNTRGRAATEDGPTHERVATNVRELRDRRRMSQSDLSDRLGEVGRPMGVSAVSKVEKGTRRVTVDDLVALALALGVNPNALLLPADTDDGSAPLTSTVQAPWRRAWAWATGEMPLEVEDSGMVRVSDLAEWFETTRPHKDSDEIAAEVAGAHRHAQDRHESLVAEVEAAQERWRDQREGGQ